MTLKLLACLLALIAVLVAVIEAPRARAQSMAAGEPIEARVAARGTASGSVEFAIQTRAEGGIWSGLQFGRLRFMSPRLIALQDWRYASPVAVGGGREVRVAARGTASGSVEFALQERAAGGSWGELLFGRLRFMSPRLIALQDWRYASPVSVSAPPPASAATCVLADNIDRVTAATFQVQNADGSSGTAFYIGNSEWITNHHVVEAVASADLSHGETRINASVAGSLPGHDLALLHAQPPGAVPALSFVGSRPALVSSVWVVGFPPGVSGTPATTDGIVSKHAPYSEVGWYGSLRGDGVVLQTNAVINPGNSGGPIVDDCGDVAGVATFKLFSASDGRDVDGVGFGIAAETVVAQLANLRESAHVTDATAQSSLTITAFCTYQSSEDLSADECHDRSDAVDPALDLWNVWAVGVVDFEDVIYRFNEGDAVTETGVWDALLALGAGCHGLEIAENGISTHWSQSYEFCFARSASTVPGTPSGLRLMKIDIPLAPDDIEVAWNAVPGAAWYELYHAVEGGQFTFKARATSPAYHDESPGWLVADFYKVRACNNAGCSAFSAVVTQY